MKDAPSPPAAPNYAAAAQAQGVANKDTALAQSSLGNPNIDSPYGSQYVNFQSTGPEGNFQPTITQSLNPQSQQIFNAQQQARLGLAGLSQQGIGTAQNTLGQPFNFSGPGVQTSLWASQQQPGGAGSSGLPWYENASNFNAPGQGLSPAGQAARAQQSSGSQSMYGNYGQLQGAPNLFDYGMAGANVPAGQGMADAPNLGQMGQAGGTLSTPYGMGQTPNLGAIGSANTALNTSGVAAMPVNAGMTAQNAIMSRLGPQIQRERQQQETQLRNQGLVPGGEAYGNAMTIQNQRENDLLSQAALQGIGLDLSANQQGFGQALAGGQFANQGVAQNQQAALAQQQAQNQLQSQAFGQATTEQGMRNQALAQNQQTALAQQAAQNQAQQQRYAQQFGVQGLQNQAIGQNQGAALQQQQAANAATGQGFNQQLQGAQFGNQAQQQALQQQLYQRNLPLNEISALMSGSQIQNPQFQAYQGANIQPAPVFNAAQQQAQYNQGLYGLNVGQYNQGLATMGTLGAAGLGIFSDRRLKSNIVRIGTHELGIGIYEYDIFGERQQGVMADEVLTVRPEAVVQHPSGFLMVDYGRL